ncbi:MAG TPA: hypothetical protein VIX89_11545 [Bryobacteraceae bacterium]
MVKLTPKDSSILTRITRYKTIPKPEREALLEDASDAAKEIGMIILGTSTGENAGPEITEAAAAYRKSFGPGQRTRGQRRPRRNVSD